MEKRTILTLKRPYDPDKKAIQAAQKAILEEIYLVDAKMWRESLGISPDVISLEHKCSTEILPPKDEDPLELHFILCKFGVVAFNNKSPNKPIMKIEASFFTSFSEPIDDPDLKDYYKNLDLDSEAEEFDTFIGTFFAYIYHIIPVSTAWPYWREFVQSMSTRMGYPALTVPMLEIVFKREPKREAENNVPKKEFTRRKKLSA
jgi:hypothetical protein